jgi:dethiobiotin synthetase
LKKSKNARIIFVTGTDTGVGKTLFTALALCHLRSCGFRALAMKPFCSGGLGDVRLLQSLQPGELSDREMNPFYYRAPLAPLIAAPRRRVALADVSARLRQVAVRCEVLLVEGSGGLLVPLGPGLTAADVIAELKCEVVIVARNRLGTINHTLLTVAALASRGLKSRNTKTVMMSEDRPDLASGSNPAALRRLLNPGRVTILPYLGRKAATRATVLAAASGLFRVLKPIFS